MSAALQEEDAPAPMSKERVIRVMEHMPQQRWVWFSAPLAPTSKARFRGLIRSCAVGVFGRSGFRIRSETGRVYVYACADGEVGSE